MWVGVRGGGGGGASNLDILTVSSVNDSCAESTKGTDPEPKCETLFLPFTGVWACERSMHPCVVQL